MKKILLITLAILILVPIINAQSVGDSCNVIGERRTLTETNKIYCSIQVTWQAQKESGYSCDNNFECESDVCQGDECRNEDIASEFIYVLGGLDYPPPPPPTGSPSTGGSYSSGDVTSDYYAAAGGCISEWECSEWLPCINGKKLRTCEDLFNCDRDDPVYEKPAEEMLCEKIQEPTCNDGLKNQGEEGVDCGGPCEICKTCTDQIQNCHSGDCETDIDCGGSCAPCSIKAAGASVTFWAIFITGLLTVLLLVLGIWYFKLRKVTESLGKQFDKISEPSKAPMFKL